MTMDNLRVIHLNCHKSLAPVTNLVNDFMKSNDIALLQEPYVFKTKVRGFAGFNVFAAAAPRFSAFAVSCL